jgi:small subunit ribosomal protein S1
VKVKVLDIDRERQRISLGLKQTQEDPWQRIVNTHSIGDELVGTVTKVVTFGAFVEILDGVEGLVHISELAAHHVENPREVVQPGDEIRVKILEIDSERRRLSLSAKRVEGQVLPLHPIELSEDGDQADEGAEGYEAEQATASVAAPESDAGASEQTEGESEAAPEVEAAVAEETVAAEAEPAGEEAPAVAASVAAEEEPQAEAETPAEAQDADAVQAPAAPADS